LISIVWLAALYWFMRYVWAKGLKVYQALGR
jgi:ABC-type uncharacterized transport system permease subunit